MLQSKRNQLGNANNPYQNTHRRVLAVCSAGLLRSPTIARVLQESFGYNTRACGTDEEFALVPISTALVAWADLVVFAEQEHYEDVKEYLGNKKTVVLNLPDEYNYYDDELVHAVKVAFAKYLAEEE